MEIVEIVENTGEPMRPALLVLPERVGDVAVYPNRVVPIRIV
jgi:hypothetical protein